MRQPWRMLDSGIVSPAGQLLVVVAYFGSCIAAANK
jgi:hypothetical protein